ncbi:MAG: hypothetical protein RIR18_1317 [Pseudomonadota bacterium]|jgi:PAS domain S-box-containing protein
MTNSQSQPAEIELNAVRAELQEVQFSQLRLEAALARSEERMLLITETIPALIGYFDPQQIYRYANQRYAQWFGMAPTEVIGNSISQVIGDRGYQQVKHHITQALGGETVTYEYTMRQHNLLVHGRSTLVPEISPEGSVLGCFVLSFDITEQKRMQEALVQAQKMEAIGQLTGGLAHDFNNLLTILLGNLGTLQERYQHHAEITELVSPALQASHRGAELIRRLLSFSRQQPLKPVSANIGELIQEMTPLIRRPLPTSISLTTQLPSEPLYSRVDSAQLESALLNFVLNARDAMPDGGMLMIRVSEHEIDELAATELLLAAGKYVRIDVEDTGFGMDNETQARIFEPFFTTKSFGQGSGLGLSMVYGFIKQSDGGITVQSEPDKGTHISVFLPPAPPVPATIAIEETALPRIPQGALVLLVEDEPEVRQVVRHQLLDLGYLVLEAENGNQAIEMLQHVQDVTILLTDVVMPGGMNGRELARLALQQRPELRVVLMSGYDEKTHHTESQKAENVSPSPPLLSKPFTKRELAQVLQP